MGNGATAIVRNSVRVFNRFGEKAINTRSSGNFWPNPYLPHDSTFEHNKHEQRKETVVPILVQTPKGYAEDLKDKERRGGMFREQLRKGGDGYIELVFTVLRDKVLGILLCNSLEIPEGGDGGFVGTRVGQGTERNRI
jgi:hypothetical protein